MQDHYAITQVIIMLALLQLPLLHKLQLLAAVLSSHSFPVYIVKNGDYSNQCNHSYIHSMRTDVLTHQR